MEHKAKSRIAYLREKVGLTQLGLSQLVGVTETTIQNWESGRAGTDQILRIIKFCKALECQVEDLIEVSPEPPVESAAKLSQIDDLRKRLGTDKQSPASKRDRGIAKERKVRG